MEDASTTRERSQMSFSTSGAGDELPCSNSLPMRRSLEGTSSAGPSSTERVQQPKPKPERASTVRKLATCCAQSAPSVPSSSPCTPSKSSRPSSARTSIDGLLTAVPAVDVLVTLAGKKPPSSSQSDLSPTLKRWNNMIARAATTQGKPTRVPCSSKLRVFDQGGLVVGSRLGDVAGAL